MPLRRVPGRDRRSGLSPTSSSRRSTISRSRGRYSVETQVRTPQTVFMQPQRLVVPLFQRSYVWNEESQWEPLWNDVVRVADRVLKRPLDKAQAHFLGAVVLQMLQKQTGHMQERVIIDGQ